MKNPPLEVQDDFTRFDSTFPLASGKETTLRLCAVAPHMRQFETSVKQRWIGKSLREVFAEEFPRFSSGYLETAFDEGRLRRSDGQTLDAPLRNGGRFFHESLIVEPPCEADPVRILFEDSDLIAATKPAGMPCHPQGQYHKLSLTEVIRRFHLQKQKEQGRGGGRKEKGRKEKEIYLHPINRLDRPVSGLVLLAKTPDAYKKVAAALTDSRTRKTYIARISSSVSPQSPLLSPELLTSLPPLPLQAASKQKSSDEEVQTTTEKEAVKPYGDVNEGMGQFESQPETGEGKRTKETQPQKKKLKKGKSPDKQKIPEPSALPADPRSDSDYGVFLDSEGGTISPMSVSDLSSSLRNPPSHWSLCNPLREVVCRMGVQVEKHSKGAQLRASAVKEGYAETRFLPLAHAETKSPEKRSRRGLVICRPITGRTHQIRVHLHYLKSPIEGDPLYEDDGEEEEEGRGGDSSAAGSGEQKVTTLLHEGEKGEDAGITEEASGGGGKEGGDQRLIWEGGRVEVSFPLSVVSSVPPSLFVWHEGGGDVEGSRSSSQGEGEGVAGARLIRDLENALLHMKFDMRKVGALRCCLHAHSYEVWLPFSQSTVSSGQTVSDKVSEGKGKGKGCGGMGDSLRGKVKHPSDQERGERDESMGVGQEGEGAGGVLRSVDQQEPSGDNKRKREGQRDGEEEKEDQVESFPSKPDTTKDLPSPALGVSGGLDVERKTEAPETLMLSENSEHHFEQGGVKSNRGRVFPASSSSSSSSSKAGLGLMMPHSDARPFLFSCGSIRPSWWHS
uniref:Pseudouridine synthase RsuA/RluA-like domain-containing protein n=1 Tax=Chromera velia CCMP2878 TaxID=1169474 RepID=A0A0G4G665_9ALVE|eukprot:Cvel_20354.t1-p1 / transcript=Cvel_20354.t1 / gene=Cvel_20354 / organism=Chromera_velia_CCMP2878 / gene_product=Bifunctional protein RIB2, putative / transcript_product=Bifunctional protein RIB2, putative / location=Cvel_scaffold1820:12390-15000(-) / protein_length=786 / sequence_SO=supercontig / SO=protein_coding / is_pseudo=false